MGLLKGMKDMKDMVSAAPGLIEGAQQMQANAVAQQEAMDAAGGPQAYLNQMNQQGAGEPKPGNLEPIAGVTLETYTKIIKSLGTNAGDESAQVLSAQANGVGAGDWTTAKEGWGARIKDDRAIGSRFNTLYTSA